ncbi:hypothetical protein AB0C61_33695 [Streptomyces sp. NPDC048680]|uniref:hypothetical protein n=1 Tax=Streptomyces sp. NPDC048680 TaxID=3155492 RepID=UPI0034213F4C
METWREGAHAGHTHEPNEVTIQLDGLGRQLSELLPEPGAPEGSDGPVFVDESGRRSKTLRRFGWVIAAVCVCFAVTLVGAVLGGNSSAPFLPLSGQDEHKKAEEVRVSPAPGESAGALVTPGASAGSSPSAPVNGSSVPVVPGSSAAGSSAPGAGSSAPAAVVPAADRTEISGGGGTAPTAETPVSAPPTGTVTPPVVPETPPPDTTTPPVEPPEPPVQEQEGAK